MVSRLYISAVEKLPHMEPSWGRIASHFSFHLALHDLKPDVPSCLAHDMTNDMLNETVLA